MSYDSTDDFLKDQGKKTRTAQLCGWAIVCFIISVAASCELSKPIPGAAHWNINPELKYRANQQLKEG